MTPEQRGYLHGEVIPAFSEGIDRLLVTLDLPPLCLSNAQMKTLLKLAFKIESTERLNQHEAADFITKVQAFAAENLIFIASPEEWRLGRAELERENHYAYMVAA